MGSFLKLANLLGGLPEIALSLLVGGLFILIASIVLPLIIGIVSFFSPNFATLIVSFFGGIVFIVLSLFVPDVALISTKESVFGLKALVGLTGVLIIVLGVSNVAVSALFGSLVSVPTASFLGNSVSSPETGLINFDVLLAIVVQALAGFVIVESLRKRVF
jgi:hypothetical protein